MIHRHLDVPAGTPPTALPAAALLDLLERGDLNDWAPLVREVARAPRGELAQRIAHLVDAYPMYGTSPLWRALSERARCRAEGAARGATVGARGSVDRAPATLAGLRAERGLSQSAIGKRLRISQSDVSKLERRSDLRVSTLAQYARALGGRLRCSITIASREVELRFPPRDARRSQQPARRIS